MATEEALREQALILFEHGESLRDKPQIGAFPRMVL